MFTIRVFENKTNKMLEEMIVDTLSAFYVEIGIFRHNYDGKYDGGCTVKGWYTTPEYIDENKKEVVRFKTWDC